MASSITALRLVLLLFTESFGGSENGPWSGVGESTIIVAALESRIVEDEVLGVGIGSSGVFGLPRGTFLTLPTRTTMARAGVAVCALALFKNVEPTLKVLPAGLGGLRLLYFS